MKPYNRSSITGHYTPIPNVILDNSHLFTPNENLILLQVSRKTLGFENPNYQFSIKYLSLRCGISNPSTIKAVQSLVEKGALIKITGNSTSSNKLYLCEDYFQNLKDGVVKEIDRGSKGNLQGVVKEIDTLKSTLVKSTKVNQASNEAYLKPEKSGIQNKPKPIQRLKFELKNNRIINVVDPTTENQKKIIKSMDLVNHFIEQANKVGGYIHDGDYIKLAKDVNKIKAIVDRQGLEVVYSAITNYCNNPKRLAEGWGYSIDSFVNSFSNSHGVTGQFSSKGHAERLTGASDGIVDKSLTQKYKEDYGYEDKNGWEIDCSYFNGSEFNDKVNKILEGYNAE